MARPQRRLAANVPGPFFVDDSCIDCGTCWGFAPDHFRPGDATAEVWQQPTGDQERRRALLALQACPVAAIGAPRELLGDTPRDGFPELLLRTGRGDVHYCGWASRRSFGASSYLITRPGGADGLGNVLIDSPRFNGALARRINELGGVRNLLLSHRDDVADHQAFAGRFGCGRWIHQADAGAAPEAEHRFSGTAPLAFDADLQVIPTPGHTEGSVSFLFDGQVLFSGDHLWWSARSGALVASRSVCWWNWQEQLRSLERLLDLDVRWLLPGHGGRRSFPPGEWRRELQRLLGSLSA